MKKIFAVIGLLFILPSAVRSQNPGLDEILQKYLKASAVDKLQKVNTIISTGTLVQQDAMPIKTIRMRPDKFLQVFDVADITCYQGYDGTTAWFTAPYSGNPKPQMMPPDRAGDIKIRADFDGPLVNWKAKGYQLETAGIDTVEKALAYKLKLTRPDAVVEYYSIDQKSFLLVKRQFVRMARGQEVRMDAFYKGYKPIQGIPFPFTVENYMSGQPFNTVQFESIELNKPVDDKDFKMPGK